MIRVTTRLVVVGCFFAIYDYAQACDTLPVPWDGAAGGGAYFASNGCSAQLNGVSCTSVYCPVCMSHTFVDACNGEMRESGRAGTSEREYCHNSHWGVFHNPGFHGPPIPSEAVGQVGSIMYRIDCDTQVALGPMAYTPIGDSNGPGSSTQTWPQSAQVYVTLPSCSAPTSVAHIGSPACAQGNTIQHGSSCTPVCQSGYVPSAAKLACVLGTLVGASGLSCQACTGGSVRRRTPAVSCSACGIGYYDDGDNDDCKVCQGGSVRRRTPSPTCDACGVGYYDDGTTDDCKVCQGGSVRRRTPSPSCDACGVGYYDDGTTDDCKVCTGGSVRRRTPAPGAVSCSVCGAGYYDDGNNDDCKVCTGGSVRRRTPAPGAVSCSACDAGYYDDGNNDDCKAWGCITTASGTGCKTCVTLTARTSHTHCASCNHGFYESSGVCQAWGCVTASGLGCRTCVGQKFRRSDACCASCNKGYYLSGAQPCFSCEAITTNTSTTTNTTMVGFPSTSSSNTSTTTNTSTTGESFPRASSTNISTTTNNTADRLSLAGSSNRTTSATNITRIRSSPNSMFSPSVINSSTTTNITRVGRATATFPSMRSGMNATTMEGNLSDSYIVFTTSSNMTTTTSSNTSTTLTINISDGTVMKTSNTSTTLTKHMCNGTVPTTMPTNNRTTTVTTSTNTSTSTTTIYQPYGVLAGSLIFGKTGLNRREIEIAVGFVLGKEFGVDWTAITITIQESQGSWNVVFSIVVPDTRLADVTIKAAGMEATPSAITHSMQEVLLSMGVDPTKAAVEVVLDQPQEAFTGSLSLGKTDLDRTVLENAVGQSLEQEFGVDWTAVSFTLEENQGGWNVVFSIVVPEMRLAEVTVKAAGIQANPAEFTQTFQAVLQNMGVDPINAAVEVSLEQSQEIFSGLLSFAIPVSNRTQIEGAVLKSLQQEFLVERSAIKVALEENENTWDVDFDIVVARERLEEVKSIASTVESDSSGFNLLMQANLQDLGVSPANAEVQVVFIPATTTTTSTTTTSTTTTSTLFSPTTSITSTVEGFVELQIQGAVDAFKADVAAVIAIRKVIGSIYEVPIGYESQYVKLKWPDSSRRLMEHERSLQNALRLGYKVTLYITSEEALKLASDVDTSKFTDAIAGRAELNKYGINVLGVPDLLVLEAPETANAWCKFSLTAYSSVSVANADFQWECIKLPLDTCAIGPIPSWSTYNYDPVGKVLRSGSYAFTVKLNADVQTNRTIQVIDTEVPTAAIIDLGFPEYSSELFEDREAHVELIEKLEWIKKSVHPLSTRDQVEVSRQVTVYKDCVGPKVEAWCVCEDKSGCNNPSRVPKAMIEEEDFIIDLAKVLPATTIYPQIYHLRLVLHMEEPEDDETACGSGIIFFDSLHHEAFEVTKAPEYGVVTVWPRNGTVVQTYFQIESSNWTCYNEKGSPNCVNGQTLFFEYRFSFTSELHSSSFLTSWQKNNSVRNVIFGRTGNITLAVDTKDYLGLVPTNRPTAQLRLKKPVVINTTDMLSKLEEIQIQSAISNDPMATVRAVTAIATVITETTEKVEKSIAMNLLDALDQSGITDIGKATIEGIDAAAEALTVIVFSEINQEQIAENPGDKPTPNGRQDPGGTQSQSAKLNIAEKASKILVKVSGAGRNISTGITQPTAVRLTSAVGIVLMIESEVIDADTDQLEETGANLRTTMTNVGEGVLVSRPPGETIELKDPSSGLMTAIRKETPDSLQIITKIKVGGFEVPNFTATHRRVGEKSTSSMICDSVSFQYVKWPENPYRAFGNESRTFQRGDLISIHGKLAPVDPDPIEEYLGEPEKLALGNTVRSFSYRVCGEYVELEFPREDPLRFYFELENLTEFKDENNTEVYSCQFFNETLLNWSSGGCWPESFVNGTLACACNHATGFDFAFGLATIVEVAQCPSWGLLIAALNGKGFDIMLDETTWLYGANAIVIWTLLIFSVAIIAWACIQDSEVRNSGFWNDEYFCTNVPQNGFQEKAKASRFRTCCGRCLQRKCHTDIDIPYEERFADNTRETLAQKFCEVFGPEIKGSFTFKTSYNSTRSVDELLALKEVSFKRSFPIRVMKDNREIEIPYHERFAGVGREEALKRTIRQVLGPEVLEVKRALPVKTLTTTTFDKFVKLEGKELKSTFPIRVAKEIEIPYREGFVQDDVLEQKLRKVMPKEAESYIDQLLPLSEDERKKRFPLKTNKEIEILYDDSFIEHTKEILEQRIREAFGPKIKGSEQIESAHGATLTFDELVALQGDEFKETFPIKAKKDNQIEICYDESCTPIAKQRNQEALKRKIRQALGPKVDGTEVITFVKTTTFGRLAFLEGEELKSKFPIQVRKDVDARLNLCGNLCRKDFWRRWIDTMQNKLVIRAVHSVLSARYRLSRRTLDAHLWGRDGHINDGLAIYQSRKMQEECANITPDITDAFAEYLCLHGRFWGIWYQFLSNHRVLCLRVRDIELSAAKRAKLDFVDGVVGTLFIAALWYDGSGELTSTKAPLVCRHAAFLPLRYFVIGLFASIFNALPTMLAVAFFRRRFVEVTETSRNGSWSAEVQQRKRLWWRWDMLFWVVGSTLTFFQLFVILIFIAQLTEEDALKWLLALIFEQGRHCYMYK